MKKFKVDWLLVLLVVTFCVAFGIFLGVALGYGWCLNDMTRTPVPW